MKKILVFVFVFCFLTAPTFAATTRSLKQGHTGTDVKEVQEFLKNTGYLKATPNGTFGPQTKSAVVAFQKKMKLKTTGIVDQKTRNLLVEKNKEIKISSEKSETGPCLNTALKTYLASDTPKSIDVNPGQKNVDMAHYTFEGDGKITKLVFNINMDTGDAQTNPNISLIPTLKLYDEAGNQIASANFDIKSGYIFTGSSLVTLKKDQPRTIVVKADIGSDIKNKQTVSVNLGGCKSYFTDSNTNISKQGFGIYDLDQKRIGLGNPMTILGETSSLNLLHNETMIAPVGVPAGQ